MNQLVLTLSIIHNGRKNDVNRGKVGAGSHLLIFIKFHQERKIFCEDKAITVWRVQGFQLFMVGFFQLQVEGGWVDGSAVWKSNPNFIFFLRFEILCLMHIIFWRNIYFFCIFHKRQRAFLGLMKTLVHFDHLHILHIFIFSNICINNG